MSEASSVGFQRFAERNRVQLKEAAKADALVVIPLGATEQHGPHLATGMDLFTVELIAHEAAKLAGESIPVLVTPALPFGSSHHHLIFGGTLSLSTETYYRVLMDLLESLVADGFQSLFLLNGHGGNHELAQLAVRDTVLRHRCRAAAASYWNLASEALHAAEAHVGRNLPGHAGDFETSVMLSFRPDLVSPERPSREGPHGNRPMPFRDERHGFWKEIDGFTDSPANATAENGLRFRQIIVEAVAKAWVDHYRS